MDRETLPQIPPFNLQRSGRFAEVLTDQAHRTDDVRLRRSLLRAACTVLDQALGSSDPAIRPPAAVVRS